MPAPLISAAPCRIALGMDLTEVPRIAAAIERWGERFLARVFSDGELRRRRQPAAFAQHVAGLFAAKEAAMKALGTGWRADVRFCDIILGKDPLGKPTLRFAGAAARRARSLGVASAEVTISHTDTLAAACVALVLSCAPDDRNDAPGQP
jgi:holo-[acyl-carrier protein] synthase